MNEGDWAGSGRRTFPRNRKWDPIPRRNDLRGRCKPVDSEEDDSIPAGQQQIATPDREEGSTMAGNALFERRREVGINDGRQNGRRQRQWRTEQRSRDERKERRDP